MVSFGMRILFDSRGSGIHPSKKRSLGIAIPYFQLLYEKWCKCLVFMGELFSKTLYRILSIYLIYLVWILFH